MLNENADVWWGCGLLTTEDTYLIIRIYPRLRSSKPHGPFCKHLPSIDGSVRLSTILQEALADFLAHRASKSPSEYVAHCNIKTSHGHIIDVLKTRARSDEHCLP